jgi:hypothetical protein
VGDMGNAYITLVRTLEIRTPLERHRRKIIKKDDVVI